MRCDFVKDARIVAFQELPGFSCGEAIKTARTMFAERTPAYDGVQVWTFTRRIYQLGAIARKPPTKSSDPARSITVEAGPTRRSAFGRKAAWIARRALGLAAWT